MSLSRNVHVKRDKSFCCLAGVECRWWCVSGNNVQRVQRLLSVSKQPRWLCTGHEDLHVRQSTHLRRSLLLLASTCLSTCHYWLLLQADAARQSLFTVILSQSIYPCLSTDFCRCKALDNHFTRGVAYLKVAYRETAGVRDIFVWGSLMSPHCNLSPMLKIYQWHWRTRYSSACSQKDYCIVVVL